MKKEYINPNVAIQLVEDEDVIRTSGMGAQNDDVVDYDAIWGVNA